LSLSPLFFQDFSVLFFDILYYFVNIVNYVPYYGLASTIVATQLPITSWHENIRDPTIADAIMDRLIHNAHKINLKGESMRKLRSSLTQDTNSEK